MWEAADSDICDICEYSRNKSSEDSIGDQYLNKENLSPIKNEDLSFYEGSERVQVSCVDSSPNCPPLRRALDDIDASSQDSGYGTSYHGESGKYPSYNSPRGSFTSFGSMEDDFLEDFLDVEPLDKHSSLPKDFCKLINHPLIHRNKPKENHSPKDTIIRPLFRRALSLQNPKVTPNSSRVRTSLFGASEIENKSFKRPEPPTNIENGFIKRSKLFFGQIENPIRPVLKRAVSTDETIMCAVQKSSTEPDLIGDFSKNFCLPLVNGKHQDLKAISPETLAKLMKSDFSEAVETFKVIDCRYPYEFKGGHINGAINIYAKDQILELLHENRVPNCSSPKRHILVFHCEFSSERAPNLYRYLRKEDRQRNESVYPSLHYPEIYLLEGGYKSFFHKFSEMCVPIAYKEMLHPDHEEDLRHFRQKAKTWDADNRQTIRSSKSAKRL